MVFDKVKKLLSEQLEVDPDLITIDTDIIGDLGADSLDLVELVMTLEEKLGVTIADESIGDMTTVRDIVTLVEKLM